MIADRRQIQDLVVSVQQAFLDAPALRLTKSEAEARFAAGTRSCEAVLDFLVEAGVLARTAQGHYVRHMPRPVDRAAA